MPIRGTTLHSSYSDERVAASLKSLKYPFPTKEPNNQTYQYYACKYMVNW